MQKQKRKQKSSKKKKWTPQTAGAKWQDCSDGGVKAKHPADVINRLKFHCVVIKKNEQPLA